MILVPYLPRQRRHLAASSATSDIWAASLRRSTKWSISPGYRSRVVVMLAWPMISCSIFGGLGPRVAHGPVERVVRHLFPAVLGEGGVGAVGVLLELGERARLLLDVVGGARDRCGHGVALAVGEAQQRPAAGVVPVD